MTRHRTDESLRVLAREARFDFADGRAGHAEGALFYPIRPCEEAESWAELPEAAEAFFAGRYAAGMEAEEIARFETLLPETPPWETKA